MISAELNVNLSRMRRKLTEYAALSGLTEEQALFHQAAQLAWDVYRGMRAIMPKKGSIRSSRLELLKARGPGHGVHVREAVLREVAARYQMTTSVATKQNFFAMKKRGKVKGYSREIWDPKTGKFLNFRAAAVQRELAVRETGRGFMAYSVPRPERGETDQSHADLRSQVSRYGFELSRFMMNPKGGSGMMAAELRWLGARGEYNSPVTGLSKQRQMQVLSEAVAARNADIDVYIKRKLKELTKELGLN